MKSKSLGSLKAQPFLACRNDSNIVVINIITDVYVYILKIYKKLCCGWETARHSSIHYLQSQMVTARLLNFTL